MTEAHDVLHGGSIETSTLVADLRSAAASLAPFDDRVVAFTADLSRDLRKARTVKGSPALAALAYWIRPATIERLREDWKALVGLTPQNIRVPRGVVFHLPPTNVDTLFVYSWILSALCGNANVVRLSPRSLDASTALVDIVRSTLTGHPEVAATASFVSYGHERQITESLSNADVRVIWGGDEAVAAIKAVPSSPSTRDLAFPDRYSMAAFDAASVVTADDAELSRLAQALYNDAYWFDQLGCASPRLIIWVGDAGQSAEASERLVKATRRHLSERGHPQPPTSAVIAKFVHVADAAARDVTTYVDRNDNLLTLATTDRLRDLERDSPGGGLFYETRVDSLTELAPVISRREQTLSVYGLRQTELEEFVESVGARGIDRIVPVGEALNFGRYWDGIDFFVEFTRIVHVRSGVNSQR